MRTFLRGPGKMPFSLLPHPESLTVNRKKRAGFSVAARLICLFDARAVRLAAQGSDRPQGGTAEGAGACEIVRQRMPQKDHLRFSLSSHRQLIEPSLS